MAENPFKCERWKEYLLGDDYRYCRLHNEVKPFMKEYFYFQAPAISRDCCETFKLDECKDSTSIYQIPIEKGAEG